MLSRPNDRGIPRNPTETKETQPLNLNGNQPRYLVSTYTFGGEIVARGGLEAPFLRPLEGFVYTPAVIHITSSRPGEIQNQDIPHIANHFLNALEAKDIHDKKFEALLSYDSDYDAALFNTIKSYKNYSVAVFQFSFSAPLNVIFPKVLSNLIIDYISDTYSITGYPGDLHSLKMEPSPIVKTDRMANCIIDMTNCIKIIFSKNIIMDPLYPQMLPFIMEDLYAIHKLRTNLLHIMEDLINKKDTFYKPQVNAIKKIVNTPIFPKIRLTSQSELPSIEEAKLSAISIACRLTEFIGSMEKQILEVCVNLYVKPGSCNSNLFRPSPKKLPQKVKELLEQLLILTPNYFERKKQIKRMPHLFKDIDSLYLEDAKAEILAKRRLLKK